LNEQDLLEKAIEAMDAQRSILGEDVVNPAIAVLREKQASLQSQASAGQRKQVSVLFADLVEFTTLAEKMDTEQAGELMKALWQRLDVVIMDHDGLIDKHIGEAVVAVWGAGESQENDAEQAVHTALALLNEINVFSKERSSSMRLRVGVHTGLVYVTLAETSGRYNITGMTLQIAEKIQHAAPPGGILITQDTLAHVRGVFRVTSQESLELNDMPDPLPLYQVVSARPRAFRMLTRGIEGIETRMIGRDAELKRLQELFSQAISKAAFSLVTICGEAGVGKSRLVQEFDQWVDGLAVRVRYFKGRAGLDLQRTPYSLLRDLFAYRFQILDTDENSTVWKKVEQGVSEALGSGDNDRICLYAHFLGHMLGFDFSQSPLLSGILSDSRQLRDRALGYMNEYFHAYCRRQPVLILLEDIQWADDASLEAVQNLADNLVGRPAMIVCTTRSTLYQRKPDWPQLTPVRDRDLPSVEILLNRLSLESTRKLVEHILQKMPAAPEALIELITTSAEGNPFYIEELTKMLIEDGVILKGEENWQVDSTRLTSARVPSTLTGVLQARLDSLQMRERHTLQSAAVVGPVFWDAAVAHLFLPEEREQCGPIDEILTGLRDREMIFRRDKSAYAGTLEYIFKNIVLREVTYESIPGQERLARHARVADWLVRVTEHSGRAGEFARLVAEHFERSAEIPQAAVWYLRAAQQAAARFALPEAVYCFSHALELTANGDLEARYTLLAGREQIYDLQAERLQQLQDLDSLTSLAEQLPDPRPRIQAALRRANFGLLTGIPARPGSRRPGIAGARCAGMGGNIGTPKRLSPGAGKAAACPGLFTPLCFSFPGSREFAQPGRDRSRPGKLSSGRCVFPPNLEPLPTPRGPGGRGKHLLQPGQSGH
jgi:class 3 adenylate cyclase